MVLLLRQAVAGAADYAHVREEVTKAYSQQAEEMARAVGNLQSVSASRCFSSVMLYFHERWAPQAVDGVSIFPIESIEACFPSATRDQLGFEQTPKERSIATADAFHHGCVARLAEVGKLASCICMGGRSMPCRGSHEDKALPLDSRLPKSKSDLVC